LNHLDASHFIISTETKISRKPPKSNLGLLQDIFVDLESSTSVLESLAVPSLKNLIIVNNSSPGGGELLDKIRGGHAFENVLEQGNSHDIQPRSWAAPALDVDDIINIQFTSGTTSMPKAACLSHFNILNNAKSIGDRMLLTPEDVVCCPPPLFQ